MKRLLLILLCLPIMTLAQTEKGTFSINLNTDIGYSSTEITGTDSVYYYPVENYWGGTTMFQKGDNHSVTDFNINITNFSSLFENVSINLFIVDNLSLGLLAQINSNKEEYSPTEEMIANGSIGWERKTFSLLLAPKIRYYINVGNKVSFFPEIVFGRGSSTSKLDYKGSTPDPEDIRAKLNMFNFGFGSSILISKNLAIEPVLSYSITKRTDEDALSELLANGEDYWYDVITKTKVFSFTINLSFYL